MRQGPQRRNGIEFAARINGKDASPHVPRPEERGPGGLGPARVRNAPMQIGCFNIEPKFTRDAMTEAVAGLRVENHFGGAGSATRKINNSRFVAVRQFTFES